MQYVLDQLAHLASCSDPEVIDNDTTLFKNKAKLALVGVLKGLQHSSVTTACKPMAQAA